MIALPTQTSCKTTRMVCFYCSAMSLSTILILGYYPSRHQAKGKNTPRVGQRSFSTSKNSPVYDILLSLTLTPCPVKQSLYDCELSGFSCHYSLNQVVLHIQQIVFSVRGAKGVHDMVGMVPWPLVPGTYQSFLCKAKAVATWPAGCELQIPVKAPPTTSFTQSTGMHIIFRDSWRFLI